MLVATQRMLQYFEERGTKYTLMDPDSRGRDVVKLSFSSERMSSLNIMIIVGADNEDIALRCWTICNVPADKRNKMLDVVNKLNCDYRWYYFYIDSDEEVCAGCDAVITPDTIGPVARELAFRGANIIDDDAYPALIKALWS